MLVVLQTIKQNVSRNWVVSYLSTSQ